eukprot:389326-Prymnesium_polylepis.1
MRRTGGDSVTTVCCDRRASYWVAWRWWRGGVFAWHAAAHRHARARRSPCSSSRRSVPNAARLHSSYPPNLKAPCSQ